MLARGPWWLCSLISWKIMNAELSWWLCVISSAFNVDVLSPSVVCILLQTILFRRFLLRLLRTRSWPLCHPRWVLMAFIIYSRYTHDTVGRGGSNIPIFWYMEYLIGTQYYSLWTPILPVALSWAAQLVFTLTEQLIDVWYQGTVPLSLHSAIPWLLAQQRTVDVTNKTMKWRVKLKEWE